MTFMQRTMHTRQNLAQISGWSDQNSDAFACHRENPNGILRIRLWQIPEMKMIKEAIISLVNTYRRAEIRFHSKNGPRKLDTKGKILSRQG